MLDLVIYIAFLLIVGTAANRYLPTDEFVGLMPHTLWSQHRTRMRRMRDAEQRRNAALAVAMTRHPAGNRRPAASLPEADFIARARATHVSDQVLASMAEAMRQHPATRGAIERAKAAHPASQRMSAAARVSAEETGARIVG